MFEAFLRRVLSWRAENVLFASVAWGFALVCGSVVLTIDQVQAPGDARFVTPPCLPREVGYLWALNWSVNFVVLVPFALFLMVKALQGISEALKRLGRRGMVRDRAMRVIMREGLSSAWEGGPPSRPWVLRAGVMIAFALSMFEWFTASFLRLIGDGSPSGPPDFDWGLAGIMRDWPMHLRLLNALFDFFAFSSQAMLFASLLAFLLYLLDLRSVLPQSDGDEPYLLVPDLKSGDDSRCGYQEFEKPLRQMFTVAMITFLMCYLVRIQGLYMAANNASRLGEFVGKEIIAVVGPAGVNQKVLVAPLALFEAGGANRQFAFASIGYILNGLP